MPTATWLVPGLADSKLSYTLVLFERHRAAIADRRVTPAGMVAMTNAAVRNSLRRVEDSMAHLSLVRTRFPADRTGSAAIDMQSASWLHDSIC